MAGCIRYATPRLSSFLGHVWLGYFVNIFYAWYCISYAILEQIGHLGRRAENPQVARHLPGKCCITLRSVLHGVYGERFESNIHENITVGRGSCHKHVYEILYQREVYKGKDRPCNTTSSETVAYPETGYKPSHAGSAGLEIPGRGPDPHAYTAA